MPDWLNNPLYELCGIAARVTLVLGFRMRVLGHRNFPQSGPVLLIANHQSFFDPVAVGTSVLPRHINYLARKTLFDNRWFAKLLYAIRTVPIDQEGVGESGLMTILDQIRAGQAVLVFPEGERCSDGEVHPFKPGISLLIKRVHAPIVPIGIAGCFEALPRQRNYPHLSPLFLPNRPGIVISIGRPLDPGPYRAMPREQMLVGLFDKVLDEVNRAKRLRDRTCWRRSVRRVRTV